MEIGNLSRWLGLRFDFSEQQIRALLEMIVFSVVTGYIFYRHFAGGLLVFIVSMLSLSNRVKMLSEIEKDKKCHAFLDLLNILRRLSASGMSIQLCFSKAQQELKCIYPDENAWIIRSLYDLNYKLSMDPYPGQYITQWGVSENIREIEDFGQVMNVIQNYGGDMGSAMSECSSMISERLQTENFIKMLAASKIFEQKVLFYLGYVMILILYSSMSDMFSVLYTTLIGRSVMTLSLLIMLVGKRLGLRLSRIEV